jgi:fucose permease
MLWVYVFSGFAVLFGAAYYDNIRGPLLPVITAQLGLSHALSSWFLIVGHLAAVVCTYAIIAALNRWTERDVTIVTCALGVITGVVALTVHDVPTLMVLAACIGATTSSMGAMCNVLVLEGTPVARQGRMLSGLHTMYGVGSIFASGVVGATIRGGGAWPLVVLAPAPLVLALMLFMRVKLAPHVDGIRREPKPGKLSELQVLIITLFSLYVAAEVISSMWLSTYLVEQHHMSVPAAAGYLSGFFAAMTVTRFSCFLCISPRHELTVIIGALVLPIAAFAVGLAGWPAAFVLVGLVGPFFPLFLARVNRNFPDKWRSLTVWIIVAMQVVLVMAHLSLGRIADLVTISRAYWLPLILFVTTFGMLLLYLHLERRYLRPSSGGPERLE